MTLFCTLKVKNLDLRLAKALSETSWLISKLSLVLGWLIRGHKLQRNKHEKIYLACDFREKRNSINHSCLRNKYPHLTLFCALKVRNLDLRLDKALSETSWLISKLSLVLGWLIRGHKLQRNKHEKIYLACDFREKRNSINHSCLRNKYPHLTLFCALKVRNLDLRLDKALSETSWLNSKLSLVLGWLIWTQTPTPQTRKKLFRVWFPKKAKLNKPFLASY